MKQSQPKQPIKSLIVRMDDELYTALKNHSFENDESRAETVRKALRAYLPK